MAILRSYTPLVEPLSLDEAFLDVTAATADGILAVGIAREILDRIHRETRLTASAGVSYNPKKSSYGPARAGIAPSGNHGDWVIWATM